MFYSNSSYAKEITPLTNDQLIEKAPSIAATKPADRVSNKYDFIPTIEVVDMLRSAGWVPFQAMQSKTRKEELEGYQKHRIRFLLGGEIKENSMGLSLTNAHHGLASFLGNVEIWRKVCGNGLMMSNPAMSFSHRHVGFDYKAFVESAEKMADHQREVMEQIEDMEAITLTPDERGVFALAAHHLLDDAQGNAHPVPPQKLLTARRWIDRKQDNLWVDYNTIQENIIKGGASVRKFDEETNRFKKRSIRKVRSIDRDIKLNKALHTLATEMLRLKQAQA